MSAATVVETDIRLRDAIVRQLEWDPEVDAHAIDVGVAEGAVTLAGEIDSYAGALAAERAVRRLRGVHAVANEILVLPSQPRADADIARDAVRTLASPPSIADNVQAVVRHGRITLTGTVEWLFERQLAESLIHHIRGVTGVHNAISVSPRVSDRDVRRRIRRELHQLADVDAQHIDVIVDGQTVTLTGRASTWAQREAAAAAAARAPGVARIENRLEVMAINRPVAAPSLPGVIATCATPLAREEVAVISSGRAGRTNNGCADDGDTEHEGDQQVALCAREPPPSEACKHPDEFSVSS
jgi:osmotically-inducible protein OsmY